MQHAVDNDFACLCVCVRVQGLLRQTEAEHPDYYLLLVCIQQFRSFTAQYHHLLQHNQELLLHNRKEAKRSEAQILLLLYSYSTVQILMLPANKSRCLNVTK